ncbi:LAQU0S05e01816g1_1 [Lachancea quebecensis]|uniref:LAQU0S05e01816g1_1 n=1 Tax=Lachancea quebecensis TaxID=1654605 RepID=A0A0P1KQT9_9SACH|nr:LAQU0S05e01816g1_1 [Lachancea quebecensis]
MKRSSPDDCVYIVSKKCQMHTACSGADAFRAMLRSARRFSRPAAPAASEQTCYYCSSRAPTSNCGACHESVCTVCSAGGTATCLNCRVAC